MKIKKTISLCMGFALVTALPIVSFSISSCEYRLPSLSIIPPDGQSSTWDRTTQNGQEFYYYISSSNDTGNYHFNVSKWSVDPRDCQDNFQYFDYDFLTPTKEILNEYPPVNHDSLTLDNIVVILKVTCNSTDKPDWHYSDEEKYNYRLYFDYDGDSYPRNTDWQFSLFVDFGYKPPYYPSI